jgi:FtsH-binding integral membrane protein
MDTLSIKTFGVILMMLCATALAARRNNAFETRWEFWGLLIGGFALLFIIPATTMPINFILAFVFAVIMGALIGPGIKGMMVDYVIRKRLEQQGYTKASLANLPVEEREALVASVVADVNNPAHNNIIQDWNGIIGLAMYGTGAMTLITAIAVVVLDIDFSFLGMGLFVALIGLVVMGLLNTFFFKSPIMRLVGSYIGALIFSLYLLYDFNRLEAAVKTGDTSWETAIGLGISIYLDIINLFMDLLDILSSHN